MTRKVYTILSSLMLLLSISTFAQSSITDLRVEFKMDDSGQASALPDVVFKLSLSDTVNINKIILTLGSSQGASDYLSYNINIDGSNLPQGVSFLYNNNIVEINTGTHSGIVKYYATAKIQYANGSYSALSTINNVE